MPGDSPLLRGAFQVMVVNRATLEMEGLVQEATDPGSPVDYESLEHLPRRR